MDYLIFLAEADPNAWVGPVLQLVQFGGFGALVWFYNWVQIPAMQAQHALERKEWTEYLHQRDAKFDELLRQAINCISEANSNARHPH